MNKIYNSTNKIQAEGALTEGVCPGASCHWVKFALKGLYEENPTKPGKNLEYTKELTTKFCRMLGKAPDKLVAILKEVDIKGHKITPNCRTEWTLLPFRFQLAHIVNKSKQYIPEGKMVDKLSIMKLVEQVKPMKGETFTNKQAFYNKLGELLPSTRIYDDLIWSLADQKTYNNVSGEMVVGHITSNNGIYIMITGTHIMAASNVVNKYYFYDVENGLFKCSGADELYRTIKLFRSPCKDANGDDLYKSIQAIRKKYLGDTDCSDWGSGAWYCVKAT